MSVGIYMYLNKINGKVYIGQSTNIQRRKKEHERRAFREQDSEYDTVLHRAFRKYGLENFQFSILEKCSNEELNKREVFWIKKKKSYFKGYNMTEGGEGGSYNKIKPQYLVEITKLLSETDTPTGEIALMYGVAHQQIGGINSGRVFYRDYIEYPIRKEEKKKEFFCSECGDEITKYSQSGLCIKCSRLQRRKAERPKPLVLAAKIVENGFEATGREYGVSGNAIKKWCVSYGMGRLKHEVAMWYQKNKK